MKQINQMMMMKNENLVETRLRSILYLREFKMTDSGVWIDWMPS